MVVLRRSDCVGILPDVLAAAAQAISCPPLTSSTTPVMKAAASKARKRIA